MPAKPRAGLRYRQEHYVGHAEDRAEVVSLNEQAQVPFGHFGKGKVLMTRDLNPLTPKILEYKFYARGVGLVLAIGVWAEATARSSSATGKESSAVSSSSHRSALELTRHEKGEHG